MEQKELSSRKQKILKAIVDLYISTAEPVGSKTIAQLPDMDFSSATIRNEMAELTNLDMHRTIIKNSYNIKKQGSLPADQKSSVPRSTHLKAVVSTVRSEPANSYLIFCDLSSKYFFIAVTPFGKVSAA